MPRHWSNSAEVWNVRHLDDDGSRRSSSWQRRKRTHRNWFFLLKKLERALEIQALHRPQAEVDAVHVESVAQLLESLEGSPDAFVQLGSVFLVKVDGVPIVRNLSQSELARLQNSALSLSSPLEVIQALQILDQGSADDTGDPSAGSGS